MHTVRHKSNNYDILIYSVEQPSSTFLLLRGVILKEVMEPLKVVGKGVTRNLLGGGANQGF